MSKHELTESFSYLIHFQSKISYYWGLQKNISSYYNYSMSKHSKIQQITCNTQSQTLPRITQLLSKNKKYRYRDNTKEKALRCDIDSYMHHLVNKENNPCGQKITRDHIQSYSNKVQLNQRRFIKKLEFLPQSNQIQEIKAIRQQIHKYLGKMGKYNEAQSSDYLEFVRLSQQSLDYLQYYLKNHFKDDKDLTILQNTDKKIILSMLKNNFKCLIDNPSEISNRIMLSFGINPLNDFHFIDWPTFSKFRKLALGTQSKMEGRNFMVNYFMVNNKELMKDQFWAIIGGIMRKLERVMNLSNVEHLIQRIQAYGNSFIGKQITTKNLQQMIISEHFFIWQELLQLIFIS